MQSGQSSMISTHWQLGMAKVPIGARGEERQADTPNTAPHTERAAGRYAPAETEAICVLWKSVKVREILEQKFLHDCSLKLQTSIEYD